MRTLLLILLLSLSTFGSTLPCWAGKREAPRHLILISIDTLRPDRLGCYGSDRSTSPALDAIAEQGIVFEDASAPSPWTKPSHASLFTGLYPSRHGASSMAATLADETVPLAELLRRRGFHTEAIVNSEWLTSHGLERGFAEFLSVPYVQGRREGSAVTAAAVRAFSDLPRGKRLFLLIHYMDVHSDYTSLPEHEQRFVTAYEGPVDGSTQQLYRIAERRMRIGDGDVRHLVDLYDAGIRQVDDDLGRLFEFLEEAGILAESLLIVTSDHGEEFLEHGSVLHGQTQHEEVARVPLILHGKSIPVGRRIDAPVSLVDVLPTALRALGLKPPKDLDGESLDGLWSDPVRSLPARFLYYEADVTFPPPGPGPVPPGTSRAIRYGRFKLHYDTRSKRARLFDLREDPGELREVSGKHPEVARLLRERLLMFLEQRRPATPDQELSPEQIEVLRSLGYLGGAP